MLILSKNQRNVNEAVWRQFTYSERTKKKLNANIQCWRSCPDIDSCIHLQPYRSQPLGRNVTIKNLFLRNNLAKAEQSLLISLTSTHWNAQGSALQVWLFSTHVHCLEDLPYESRPRPSGVPRERADQKRHLSSRIRGEDAGEVDPEGSSRALNSVKGAMKTRGASKESQRGT